MKPVNHGQTLDKPEQLKNYLLSRCSITSTNCWLWPGVPNKAGYGNIQIQGKAWLVHRLSMLLFKPSEYTEFLDVLHTCDVKLCFNPEHLYSGTDTDNQRDCLARGIHFNAAKTHCIHGHELTPDNIYTPPGTHYRDCKICRKNTSLARSTTNINPVKLLAELKIYLARGK